MIDETSFDEYINYDEYDKILHYEKDTYYLTHKGKLLGSKNSGLGSINKIPLKFINAIQELHCINIEHFPIYINNLYLPINLLVLKCANKLFLPELPISLLKLECQNNLLDTLPNLPPFIIKFKL